MKTGVIIIHSLQPVRFVLGQSVPPQGLKFDLEKLCAEEIAEIESAQGITISTEAGELIQRNGEPIVAAEASNPVAPVEPGAKATGQPALTPPASPEPIAAQAPKKPATKTAAKK